MKTWGNHFGRWALVTLTGLSLVAAVGAVGAAGPTETEIPGGQIFAKTDSRKKTVVRRNRIVKNRAPAKKVVSKKGGSQKTLAKKAPAKKQTAKKMAVKRPKATKAVAKKSIKKGSGRRLVAKPMRPQSRKPANVPSWKRSKKSVSKSKSMRKSKAHARVPHSRATPRESDSPLVSVPRSRVKREDKMFVMDDPGAGPRAVEPDPEVIGEEPSVIERSPAVNPAMTAPTKPEIPSAPPASAMAEPAPEDETAAIREPDVFDLHTGKDPLRPAAE